LLEIGIVVIVHDHVRWFEYCHDAVTQLETKIILTALSSKLARLIHPKFRSVVLPDLLHGGDDFKAIVI